MVGGRWSSLQDRRPGALPAERLARIPRPHRPPGQGPRLPNRTGRDRGGVAPASRRARGGRPGARRWIERQAAGGLRRSDRRPTTDDRRPEFSILNSQFSIPAPEAARVYDPRRVRISRRAAADPQRQARPPRPAGARSRRRDRGRGLRRAARPCRGSISRYLVAGARCAAGGHSRQLLRPRRRLDYLDPDHRAGQPVWAAAGAAPALPAPDDRRASACRRSGAGRLCRARAGGRRDAAHTDPALVLRARAARATALEPGYAAGDPRSSRPGADRARLRAADRPARRAAATLRARRERLAAASRHAWRPGPLQLCEPRGAAPGRADDTAGCIHGCGSGQPGPGERAAAARGPIRPWRRPAGAAADCGPPPGRRRRLMAHPARRPPDAGRGDACVARVAPTAQDHLVQAVGRGADTVRARRAAPARARCLAVRVARARSAPAAGFPGLPRRQ